MSIGNQQVAMVRDPLRSNKKIKDAVLITKGSAVARGVPLNDIRLPAKDNEG